MRSEWNSSVSPVISMDPLAPPPAPRTDEAAFT
jgi:hypothetical protein